MPELPDVELYLDALRTRLLPNGAPAALENARLLSPFLLRTVTPSLDDLKGRRFVELERLGKRIVFHLEGELSMVLHLMIAGRLQWSDKTVKPSKNTLALFEISGAHDPKSGNTLGSATLVLTEASKKKRARLHVIKRDALIGHDPGGLEVLSATEAEFHARITAKNHTVKRALTDARILSGIGNAYSDEILFEARLSPVTWTTRLSDAELSELYRATQKVLTRARDELKTEWGNKWPKKVTAFHPKMNVHGRYKQPCHLCGDPIQRIRYASRETNYCATCQTGGKLLADRSLSRLLGKDWPKSLEALELKLESTRES